MKLLLTKYDHTVETIIIFPIILSPSCLLFLVSLGVYIVNLCVFYLYKLIGKLTASIQFKDFR